MSKIKVSLFTFLIIFGVLLVGCSSNSEKETASTNQKAAEVKENNQTDQSSNPNETVLYYFTANEGGSISKILASSNEVVDTIKVDGVVHNVQVSPDSKMVGATVVPKASEHGGHGQDSHSESGKALFFDTTTNALIQTVEVGNHPAHIVFTEDGKYALVTNNEDNTVSVIDVKNFILKETISTGDGPHGFRISTDSQKAYIANMGEDTVSVIDLGSMKEDSKITVGQTPVTTGITSDGKTLVATLFTENMLAIVDVVTKKVEKVEVGEGPAQVYIDGNIAYVANQGTQEAPSNSVTVVDVSTKKVVGTIETGKGSHGVVASEDGKRLYVTNMFENTVTVIDTEQYKKITTIKVGITPNGITIMN